MKHALCSVFLILSIAVCSWFSVNAAAAGNNVDLIVDSDEKVTVTVSTDFLCCGVQGVLTYDSSKLRYESTDFSDADSEKNSEKSVKTEDGQLKFVLLGNVHNGTSGDFATFTFAKKGKNIPAKFNLFSVKASSATGSAVSNINAAVVMPGDCNDDGFIDVKDFIRLKKIASGESTVNSKNADCDGEEGFSGASEASVLRKYLLGVISSFPRKVN